MAAFKFTITPEQLAQKFHETYERLAPSHGYETRKESAKPWADVPANNKNLMIAVCGEILEELKKHTRELTVQEALEVCKSWELTDEEVEELMK